MIQVLIMIGAVLALLASIWKVYDTGGDHREAEVRAEYTRKAEEQRKTDEENERRLREWALQLSKNFLAFGPKQQAFYQGVTNELATQIASSPALRRDCFDADGVSRFNGQRAKPAGGPGAAPGGSDAAVRPPVPAPQR